MTAAIPSRSPFAPDEFPTPAERMHGFRVGERVRITTKLDEFTGRTGVVDMVTGGRHGVHVALDGRALAYRPDEIERVETSDGGAVPSPAPPSDPTCSRCGAPAFLKDGDAYACDEHVPDVLDRDEMPEPCRRCGMPAGALVHHEQVDGHGFEPDPTDPATVGEVPPITPGDIPGLYAVSERTAVRPPDSARHRGSSQAGHAANVTGAALLRTQAVAMDRIHQAIDAGLAESRRLGDLDAAAQAIVDAADVWADAEGDVDATITLSEAVQAWRAVRDGSRS